MLNSTIHHSSSFLSQQQQQQQHNNNNDNNNDNINRICKGRVVNLESNVPPAWWTHIFDSVYLKTDGDVVEDPQVTESEIDLLESYPYLSAIFRRGMMITDQDNHINHNDNNLPRILDLCCGQGRHTLELARRYPKLQIYGHDQSQYLIDLAKIRARNANVHNRCQFTVGDCRIIPYPNDWFDLVIIMGNSFGYFTSTASDLQVLRECNRVSRLGAYIVLDLTDGMYMKQHYSPRTWEWIDDNTFVCRERQLSKDNKCLISREVITDVNNGVIRDQFYAERLYKQDEIEMLMEMALFTPARYLHSRSPHSPRISLINGNSVISTSNSCSSSCSTSSLNLSTADPNNNNNNNNNNNITTNTVIPILTVDDHNHSSSNVITAAKTLSKRQEDLGMMEQRMLVVAYKDKRQQQQYYSHSPIIVNNNNNNNPQYQHYNNSISISNHSIDSSLYSINNDSSYNSAATTTPNSIIYSPSYCNPINNNNHQFHSQIMVNSHNNNNKELLNDIPSPPVLPYTPKDNNQDDDGTESSLHDSGISTCSSSSGNNEITSSFTTTKNTIVDSAAETGVTNNNIIIKLPLDNLLTTLQPIIKSWLPPISPVPPPNIHHLIVVLGDPRIPCRGKLNDVWNREDIDTRHKLLDVLQKYWIYTATTTTTIKDDQPNLTIIDNHDTFIHHISNEIKSFNKLSTLTNEPNNTNSNDQLTKNLDVLVFNLCDEGYKNDALKELHVPALLEIIGLPYTGATPQSLGICYDKAMVNAQARSMGIPTPQETYYLGSLSIHNNNNKHTPNNNKNDIMTDEQLIELLLTYPLFIKPMRGDNSLGITNRSVVHNNKELNNYINELQGMGLNDIIVQEYLDGNEYSIGVIGNPGLGYYYLPILQVDYTKITERNLLPILGYESKWDPYSPYWTDIQFIPAQLPKSLEILLQSRCAALFERFGCRDYARFDFRTRKRKYTHQLNNNNNNDEDDEEEILLLSNDIKLLEVNPNPGWCWDGKLAHMCKLAGYTYQDLIFLILHAAMYRVTCNKSSLSS